jgi:4-amino-4-deoxy-L-arabinose transferase-like glycosyltransferase
MIQTPPPSSGEKPPAARRSPAILIVLILLLAFAVRMVRIESQPLSGDEAYSAVVWVRSSPGVLLTGVALAVTEPHPPLALLWLNQWARLAGDSILALRAQAVFASLIILAAGYAIGRRLGDRRAAALAALLLALNPFQVWYAQFARDYSLWAAASALSALLMLRAWEKPGRLGRWIPYVFSAIITGYIFYLEVLVFAAHNLYALVKTRLRIGPLRPWLLGQAAIALALAPWYLRPQLFVNSQDYTPNGERANLLWAAQGFLLGDTLPQPWQHPQVKYPEHALGIASAFAAVLVIGSLILLWRRRGREAAAFLTLYALAPPLLLAGLSVITGRHYFHPRYVAASAMPLVLLVAFGLAGLFDSARPARRLAAGAGVGAILLLSVVGLLNYQLNPDFARGPDWVRIMQTLSDQTGKRDLIIRNFPDPAFDYYYEHVYSGGAAHYLLPDSRNAPYEEVAEQLAALTPAYDYIWFLPVRSDSWDAGQTVSRWLSAERQPISDQWIGITRLYQYAAWEPTPDQIERPYTAQFGEVARLVGSRLTPPLDSWEPGTTAAVELFWTPLSQTESSLKVFLHLRGPQAADGSTIWAQDDRFPQEGRVSTQSWQPGALLRDVYSLTIPPDAPPGDYTLAVGLYDPASGARVPLVDGGDTALLLTITLP